MRIVLNPKGPIVRRYLPKTLFNHLIIIKSLKSVPQNN